MNKKRKIKVLDLFAGVGGFSEGFILNGCDMVAHVEMDKYACETLETRMIFHALRKKRRMDVYIDYVLGKVGKEDIIKKFDLEKESNSVINKEITQDNYKEIIEEVKEKSGGDSIDIIIGGPPCQAYSHIGRARDKNKMRNDKRNYLYKLYIEFLKAFKPKIFVFENVPGIKTAGNGKYLADMQRLMDKAGYDTKLEQLDASEYGVPQSRKRIILIGWNKKSKLRGYPKFEKVSRNYRVGDFLNKLPKLSAGQGSKILKYKEKNKILYDIGIADNSFPFLLSHVTRPHNSRDLDIYKIAVQNRKKKRNLKYNELPAKMKTHKNENSFLDRFKALSYESNSCQTIVAHISKDGHYYIHPDINQNRSLSVREAARLQTFPDNFLFEGNRTAQYKQIGNAVPPLLSNMIAKKLISYI